MPLLLGSFFASFLPSRRFSPVVVVVPPMDPALGPEAGRSRCKRPFRQDSSPGRLRRRNRTRTWTGHGNAGWRRFQC
jgi:hypothetical protein